MFSLEKVSNRPLWDYIILYSIPFAYFRGFEYIGFDITMLKMFLFVSVFCLFFYVAKTLFHVTDDVSQYSKNILYVFLISSAMALVFHDQGLVMSYRSGISFAFIIFYFYLIRRKFTIREIQYMVAFYGTLWVLLWLIAQYNAPVRLFGDPDAAINEQRGISRFLIPGDCFLYMFYFLMLTKWLNNNKKIFFLCVIALFTIIFLQVTRQTIIVTLIVTIYYLYKKKKYWYLSVLSLFLAFVVYNTDIHDNTMLAKMLYLSKEQMQDMRMEQEGTRTYSYIYFMSEMPNEYLTMIFGNGFPHTESECGKSFIELKDYGIYLSDVGYPAVFVIFGILGLVVFAKLLYYILSHSFSEQVHYAVLFLLYILICNFMSFVINVSMAAICVSLYLLYLSNNESKDKLVSVDTNK